MWLTDLLPGKGEIRPTRPTYENLVGRPQTLMPVAPSDTSDTSDTKNALETSPEENGLKQSTFSQVLYKNPLSVRLLPLEDDQAVQTVDAPTPAQLENARRLLVDCPAVSAKRHCWHCVRYERERGCMAWRHIPMAEMRFQRNAAGRTLSLDLMESGAVGVLQ